MDNVVLDGRYVTTTPATTTTTTTNYYVISETFDYGKFVQCCGG